MEAQKPASHVKYLRAMRMSINPNSGFPRLSLEILLNVLLPKEWRGPQGIDTVVANRGKYGDFGDNMGRMPSRAVRGKRRARRDMGPRPAHILRNL
jgi:hypothetical protein